MITMESVSKMNLEALALLRLQRNSEAEAMFDRALTLAEKVFSTIDRREALRSRSHLCSLNKACKGTVSVAAKGEEGLAYFSRGFVLLESHEDGKLCLEQQVAVNVFILFNRALAFHRKGLESENNKLYLKTAYDLYRLSLSALEDGYSMFNLPIHNTGLLTAFLACCENIAHLHHVFFNQAAAIYFHSHFLRAFLDHARLGALSPQESEFFAFRALVAINQPLFLQPHAGAA